MISSRHWATFRLTMIFLPIPFLRMASRIRRGLDRRNGNRRYAEVRREQEDRLSEQLRPSPRGGKRTAQRRDQLQKRPNCRPNLLVPRPPRVPHEVERPTSSIHLVEKLRESDEPSPERGALFGTNRPSPQELHQVENAQPQAADIVPDRRSRKPCVFATAAMGLPSPSTARTTSTTSTIDDVLLGSASHGSTLSMCLQARHLASRPATLPFPRYRRNVLRVSVRASEPHLAQQQPARIALVAASISRAYVLESQLST